VTQDKKTAQFFYTFTPKGTCTECAAPYCEQTNGVCECSLPPSFSQNVTEIVYSDPQPDGCVKYGKASIWNSFTYKVDPPNIYHVRACPPGYRKATTADRGLVEGLLEQAFNTGFQPSVKSTPDGDTYYCQAGVQGYGYPGNIVSTSCIKYDGSAATVDGVVKYHCAEQSRSRSVRE